MISNWLQDGDKEVVLITLGHNMRKIIDTMSVGTLLSSERDKSDFIIVYILF